METSLKTGKIKHSSYLCRFRCVCLHHCHVLTTDSMNVCFLHPFQFEKLPSISHLLGPLLGTETEIQQNKIPQSSFLPVRKTSTHDNYTKMLYVKVSLGISQVGPMIILGRWGEQKNVLLFPLSQGLSQESRSDNSFLWSICSSRERKTLSKKNSQIHTVL